MSASTIGIVCLIISASGCIFCPHWIKHADNHKDRFRGIFSFVGCVFMFCVSVFLIMYDNSLLCFGQNPANAKIEINIDTRQVENSSFLYLLKEFDNNTSIDDVISIMGSTFEEESDSNYVMKYTSSEYTLMNCRPDIIRFNFNRKGTKILSITWGIKLSGQQLYTDFLSYLSKYALGEPKNSYTNKADWTGVHLEDTSYWILFQRKF